MKTDYNSEAIRNRRLGCRGGWALGFILILYLMVLLPGCAEDAGLLFGPRPPDSSSLKIFNVGYNAWDDEGQIIAGVHVWWWETFESNYSKNCLMKRYILVGRHGDTLFDKSYDTRILSSGDTISNRTKTIHTGEPKVAGAYALHILYRHSNTEFRFDTTFNIFTDDDGTARVAGPAGK